MATGRCPTWPRADAGYRSPHERDQAHQRPHLQAPLLLPGHGGRPAAQPAARQGGRRDGHGLAGEKMSAEYVGDDFRRRHGDTVWRVRADGAAGGWACVLVLVEFQSSTDPTMALRVNEYTVMLYRALLRAKMVKPGELPPVLPIVLYNGEGHRPGEAGSAAAPGRGAVRRGDCRALVRLAGSGGRPATAGRARRGGDALRDGRRAAPPGRASDARRLAPSARPAGSFDALNRLVMPSHEQPCERPTDLRSVAQPLAIQS